MLFDLFIIAAGLGAFIVSGLNNHSSSYEPPVIKDEATLEREERAREVNVEKYRDALEVVKKRYSDHDVEELVRDYCARAGQKKLEEMLTHILHTNKQIPDPNWVRKNGGYVLRCRHNPEYMIRSANSTDYREGHITTGRISPYEVAAELLHNYGLIHANNFEFKENDTVCVGWAEDMIAAYNKKYEFDSPFLSPNTILDLKVCSILKRKDPERYKDLVTYEDIEWDLLEKIAAIMHTNIEDIHLIWHAIDSVKKQRGDEYYVRYGETLQEILDRGGCWW